MFYLVLFSININHLLCDILRELCGIRDSTSSCDIAKNNDIVALRVPAIENSEFGQKLRVIHNQLV